MNEVPATVQQGANFARLTESRGTRSIRNMVGAVGIEPTTSPV